MHNPPEFVWRTPYELPPPLEFCPTHRSTLGDCDLVELDKIVELWPKLEPLEKIMDRLTVFWGAVNHLNFVKDTSETPLRH
ncbi:hypothetical protein L2E82_28298 [Cichorium intybus]|uniref:Uncharacterized protein n=1 Tax=Cichorium intybus TaxID=13427 RepID=A0ACB9CVM6_CICIN|nr:hypothetical protein L2E82_28298 [Cichorium intybus]